MNITKSLLKKIGEEIWMAEGSPVSFFGMPYPTRMVVVRLQGGKLWVWSPIALSEALVSEVEKLGEVVFLVSPNKIHHLFMGDWSLKWPKALLVASPGLKRRRKDLKFDLELSDRPHKDWEDEINQVVIDGSVVMDEVWFFHKSSSTLMVCDLVQRFDLKETKGFLGFLMKVDGLVGKRGSTPREWRLTFFQRRKARSSARKAISWKPKQVVIAHGECIWKDAENILRDCMRWLLK